MLAKLQNWTLMHKRAVQTLHAVMQRVELRDLVHKRMVLSSLSQADALLSQSVLSFVAVDHRVLVTFPLRLLPLLSHFELGPR
jgi:hypothetical protein